MTSEVEKSTPPEAKEQPRFSWKWTIIAASGAVLLLGGAVTGTLLLTRDNGASSAEESDAAGFVEVPPLVVNLRSANGSARFLRLRLLIVPSSSASGAVIREKLPLIIDRYQPFLRELRPEDLSGSAAVYRIKEELLLRSGDVLGAGIVTDILIQDLIQQ